MDHIKSFRQFLEATVKEITVTFGRFNPPTIGHEKLLNAMASRAAGGTYKIYVSQSTDENKNPLHYSEKIKLMRSMFAKHGRNIIEDASIKTIFDIAQKAYKDGFVRFVLVVGEDRVDDFSNLLKKYQGQKQKNGSFYDFPGGIDVVSAGDRDPDSDSVEGMSASKMRQAARDGDLRSFSKGLPKGYDDSISVFNLVRKRMGLKETVNFREHIQLTPQSSIREAYVRGEIFNVGDSVRLKGGEVLQIVERRPNFLVTNDSKKRWLQDVEPIQEGWATDSYKKVGGKGLLYIDKYEEQSELTKSSDIKNALINLDKLDAKYADSFKVFKNLNGAVAFKEIAYVPFFHLI